MKKIDILIIGAGLTGLTLGYLLHQKGIPFIILEARDRLGGRILTRYKEGEASIEMGATWLGEKHTAINQLLKELKLSISEQYPEKYAIYDIRSEQQPQLVKLPPNSTPSYRINGGSSTLINTLASHIPKENILLNQAVSAIHQLSDNGILVKTNQTTVTANILISTLPPYLLTSTIDIQPPLPSSLLSIARHTHTWMGESIKVGFRYKGAIWRKSTGTVLSDYLPIIEMYDHSQPSAPHYAIKAFMHERFGQLSPDERKKIALEQLQRYYGRAVWDYIDYEETVWQDEKYTFRPYPHHILPHQNNGHSAYRQSFMDGKLWVGGSETAEAFAGYMDGAVSSAYWIFKQLIK